MIQNPISPSSIPRIKVGHLKERICIKNAKTGKTKKSAVYYTYADVTYDIDHWADSKIFLPDDFDLVYMRLKRNRTIPGWVSGSSWNGLRLKADDEVLFWKRKDQEGHL